MTTTFMVKVSPALKQHVQECAARTGLNTSEFIRDCVAKATGYDLAGDDALDGRGRPRVYQSELERRQAKRKQEQERAEHERKVVQALMKKERLHDVQALEQYLAARGISLDDAPVAAAG